MERRFPSQLSGGQRQRVALARALAAEPRVLLLDEPFGALDARVRQELRQWLRRLHDEIHITSIFVTHDQEEAFAVADRVVVLRNGRIEQTGTPQEVFEHPANSFVMDFLGNVNVFHGHVENGIADLHGMRVKWPDYPHDQRRPATVYIRPHELEIERFPENELSSLRARVVHVNPVGSVIRVHLETVEDRLAIHVELSPLRASELTLVLGEMVYVAPRRVRVFVPDYSI
jgi:sulfate transport system ATP-binding protein